MVWFNHGLVWLVWFGFARGLAVVLDLVKFGSCEARAYVIHCLCNTLRNLSKFGRQTLLGLVGLVFTHAIADTIRRFAIVFLTTTSANVFELQRKCSHGYEVQLRANSAHN